MRPIYKISLVVGMVAVATTALAATGAPVTHPPLPQLLPVVPAPKIVQDNAPLVSQACTAWLAWWPSVKDNLMGPLALSGLASVAAMILPQASANSPYSVLRQLIDLVALNLRNAANQPKV